MLTREQFNLWWDALNAEFPTYKLSDDQLAAVAKSWFRELQFQDLPILTEATREWRRATGKRPHISDILERCGRLHWVEVTIAKRKHEAEWTDTNVCPCGCGGVRWALALPHSRPPMTRDRLSCSAWRVDVLPLADGHFIGNDYRGVPVWSRHPVADADAFLSASWSVAP